MKTTYYTEGTETSIAWCPMVIHTEAAPTEVGWSPVLNNTEVET